METKNNQGQRFFLPVSSFTLLKKTQVEVLHNRQPVLRSDIPCLKDDIDGCLTDFRKRQ